MKKLPQLQIGNFRKKLCSATAHLHISNGNFFHQSANFSKKCCSTTANPRFRYDVEVLTTKCCGTAVVQRLLAEFGSVGIQNYLLKRSRIRIRFWLKGTMSRDFSSPVFFSSNNFFWSQWACPETISNFCEYSWSYSCSGYWEGG